ncbi:hypothetical protein PUT24_06100, partial [Streptomyces sp. SP17KL33]|nr:hypothetical protein [Streptomyces sp. SP17KL33]
MNIILRTYQEVRKIPGGVYVIAPAPAVRRILDLTELINFHKEKGALDTVCLTRVPNPLEFGITIVDEVEVTRWFEGRVMVGGKPRVTWEMQDDRLELRLKCDG